MQRIINNPDEVVKDMLNGFVRANSDIVTTTNNPRVLKSVFAPRPGKVGVVTGGGSGHKPAFIGYLGENMVDAVAIGEIFSSPTAKSFLDAFKAADSGSGVACLYGNYSGDKMNVKMATELAEEEGYKIKTVIANDDVASAPADQREKRRGVAGEIFMWKAGGALAAKGASLDEVVAVAQKAVDNTRSIGIGLSPCTIPAVGHPNFSIEPGKMEVGIGHHGEPGVKVMDIVPAKEMAKICLDAILGDMEVLRDDEVIVLVSGLGATPVMEQYIFYNEVASLLSDKGVTIHRSYVGNYFTSLEMMGVTLSLMKLDDQLKELMDYKVYTVALKQF